MFDIWKSMFPTFFLLSLTYILMCFSLFVCAPNANVSINFKYNNNGYNYDNNYNTWMDVNYNSNNNKLVVKLLA